MTALRVPVDFEHCGARVRLRQARHDRLRAGSASLLGALGAPLAIPAAAAIQIVIRDWWSNREHKAQPEGSDA